MITKEDLNSYVKVCVRIKEIADKWSAIEGYGYSAQDVKIVGDKILFYSQHYDGICFRDYISISVNYIFDDYNLESDANQYFKIKKEKSAAKLTKQNELLQHPKVREYIQSINIGFHFNPTYV